MDDINPTILKTTIEAIPLLTEDNFTIWRTRMNTLLNLAKLKDTMSSDNLQLSPEDNTILSSILISKLSGSTHTTIINSTSEEDAKLIWKDILKHFVSAQPANRARIYILFKNITYNESDINSFILEVKSGINWMQEIGILLPQDVLAYMILRKLPDSLKVIKQQVTHSKISSEITPDAVLDHLRIHMNEQRLSLSTDDASNLAGTTSLFTDPSKKCKKKRHNVLANHPKH